MAKSDLTKPSSVVEMPAKESSAGTWRFAVGATIGGGLLLIAIYANTSLSMYNLWSRMNAFDHAFLILPVCLYLIWERRDRLALTVPVPNRAGMALLAGFGVLWLIADAVDVIVGRQFALIGMVESFVFTVLPDGVSVAGASDRSGLTSIAAANGDDRVGGRYQAGWHSDIYGRCIY